MNKLFKKYSLEYEGFDPLSITGATTNLQQATKEDIVFYRLQDSDASQDVFNKRLESSQAGIVVVSSEPKTKIRRPYVVLEYSQFQNFQYELVKTIYPNYLKTKVIGITGTNGKSTVVHLCQEILKANGYKAYSIGTIGVCDGEKELVPDPGATTPSYLDLCRILHTLSDYEYACLEVSSHALVQERLGNINLVCSGWTNITQDHLDYHKTMDEYFKAKALIANYSNEQIILSPGEKSLEENCKSSKLPYVVANSCDYDKSDAFRLEYNKKNFSLAIELVSRAVGKEVKTPDNLSLPKGRYNTFRLNKSVFVVDYAHTPDAIENVTRETKKAFPTYELITVFGCGGDRDRTKRPKMLEAALESSDSVIVTTDNPRTEKPEEIIADIVRNNTNKNVKVIQSREAAIADVVRDYEKNTIVVIAGKGHEEYQDVNGVKNYFSDIEEVKKALGSI